MSANKQKVKVRRKEKEVNSEVTCQSKFKHTKRRKRSFPGDETDDSPNRLSMKKETIRSVPMIRRNPLDAATECFGEGNIVILKKKNKNRKQANEKGEGR